VINESDALTEIKYGKTKQRGDKLDPVSVVYHKYNMGCTGIEFGHLRPQVSFTSAPNRRNPVVESTDFKSEIPDVMYVLRAQQTSSVLSDGLNLLKINWIRDGILNILYMV
jgi:hypothetical protein